MKIVKIAAAETLGEGLDLNFAKKLKVIIEAENYRDLLHFEKVTRTVYDALGERISFESLGRPDRIYFVDEEGNDIPMDNHPPKSPYKIRGEFTVHRL